MGVAVGVGVGVAVQGNGSVKTHPAPSMIFNCNNSSFGKSQCLYLPPMSPHKIPHRS